MILTKSEKVVAILVSIGSPKAPELLKHFKKDEMKALLDIARGFKTIEPSLLEVIIGEFERDFAKGTGLVGSGDLMQELVLSSIGSEEFANLTKGDLPQISPLEEDVWAILAKADAESIFNYLNNENEQAVSHILVRLPSIRAAEILVKFENNRRTNIACRMLTARAIRPEAVKIIEESLAGAFGGATSAGPANEVGQLTSILNELDRDLLEDLLEDLETRLTPEELSSVTARLFRFEDIPRLDTDSRAAVFDSIDAEMLTDALRGTDSELRDSVLAVIGQRSRRMIESDLAAGTKGNLQQTTIARRAIVAAVLERIEKGTINLSDPSRVAA
jgi:flagellar motor switch protein FliG